MYKPNTNLIQLPCPTLLSFSSSHVTAALSTMASSWSSENKLAQYLTRTFLPTVLMRIRPQQPPREQNLSWPLPWLCHSRLYSVKVCYRECVTCLNCRPLKKVLFDTTGFLEAQNLTQEQRDSRQNLYDNRSKEQCFEAICEHIIAV